MDLLKEQLGQVRHTRVAVEEVVWEETAVNVAGFYNSDFNGFLLCHSLRIECERQEQRCQNLFHNLPFFVLQCKITKKKTFSALELRVFCNFAEN